MSVSGQFGKTEISIGEIQNSKENEMIYASILGDRLIGIGHNYLMLYHNSLNIPLPLTKSTFQEAQYSLLLACEEMAKISMNEAKKELCRMKLIDENDTVSIVASYNVATQTRCGNSGVGHSRYAFASAISIDTGKVVSYGDACNSCIMVCSKYENDLRDDRISKEEFNKLNEKHSPVCPATFSSSKCNCSTGSYGC